VIESILEEGLKCHLAGMTSWTVSTVMAKGNRLREIGIQPKATGDRHGDLGYLKGVGEAGTLMVGREDEDLRLAR
jgi:hypothetical protein